MEILAILIQNFGLLGTITAEVWRSWPYCRYILEIVAILPRSFSNLGKIPACCSNNLAGFALIHHQDFAKILQGVSKN